MSGILMVTWDGGGNVPPTLGLAAELRRRGHDVAVLGHPQQAAGARAAGATFEAYDRLPAWDPARRRSDPAFLISYLRLFTDRRFGDELRSAVARRRPDAIVVDALLPAALAAAVSSGVPTIVLVHTVEKFVSNFARGPVGAIAALKGFPLGPSLSAASATCIASPRALADQSAGADAHYVGPIFGPGENVPGEAAVDGGRIIVSLSTIDYPGMLRVLQRIVDAVGELSADVVVTTGSAIDPREVRAPSSVQVLRRGPHSELLADAALLIGHAGHGTTMKALAAGVPLVVRPMAPLGDQPLVAAAVEGAGVGVRLRARDSVEQIRRTVAAALTDRPMHERARALGRELRGANGAALAADLVESASRGAGGRRPPKRQAA